MYRRYKAGGKMWMLAGGGADGRSGLRSESQKCSSTPHGGSGEKASSAPPGQLLQP